MIKNTKMTSAVLLIGAALTMGACGTTSKMLSKAPKASNNSPIVRVDEAIDNNYLILSDAQRAIVKNNNTFDH